MGKLRLTKIIKINIQVIKWIFKSIKLNNPSTESDQVLGYEPRGEQKR